MSFLNLILKNPFRNRTRVLLSISGIGIGIITIIVLGAITNGLIVGAENSLHVTGNDFIVMSPDGSESISDNWISKIEKINGVESLIPVYNGIATIDGNNFLSIQGMDNNDLAAFKINIINGTTYTNESEELILGKVAAERFEKSLNDTILISGKEWKIVGIYESGDPNLDTESIASMGMVQELMDDEGKISGMYVKAEKGADIESIKKDIENKYGDNLSAISSISEMETNKEVLDMLYGAKWGISLLAILVGGIGIINTMIMSVYERTREIGVLKAVGWKSKRVIGMILAESIVITLMAGLVGSLLGIVFVQLLSISGILSGMEPILSISIFIEAIIISLAVGMVGGLYPAIKASRLHPTEALRYE